MAYLLKEALKKIATVQDAVDAMSDPNLVNGKIPTELKEYADSKEGRDDIERYLQTAEDMHVDMTKTIQMAVRLALHTEGWNPCECFSRYSFRDFCQSLAKFSTAPWLKSSDFYKGLFEKGTRYTKKDIENFWIYVKETVKSRQHGTKSAYELLYKDSDWLLMTPKSYEGEIAIATYGKGNDIKKCQWCTAGSTDHYYNYYTYNNSRPLYVIKCSDGNSWQIAFRSYTSDTKVEFLNEFDHRDNFTAGEWKTKMPRGLQEKIINVANDKSLADYVDYENELKGKSESFQFRQHIIMSCEYDLDFNEYMMSGGSSGVSDAKYYAQIPGKKKVNFAIDESTLTPSYPRNFPTDYNGNEKDVIRYAVLQFIVESQDLDGVSFEEKYQESLVKCGLI